MHVLRNSLHLEIQWQKAGLYSNANWNVRVFFFLSLILVKKKNNQKQKQTNKPKKTPNKQRVVSCHGSRWYKGCRPVNKVPLTATINIRTSKCFLKIQEFLSCYGRTSNESPLDGFSFSFILPFVPHGLFEIVLLAEGLPKITVVDSPAALNLWMPNFSKNNPFSLTDFFPVTFSKELAFVLPV